MESSYGFCGIATSRFDSKAELMVFLMQTFTCFNEKTNRKSIDLKRVKKCFDFVTDNVSLPDVKKDPNQDLAELYQLLMTALSSLTERKPPPKPQPTVEN